MRIITLGELREATKDLNDNDFVVIETTDLKTGDAIDLYPMYIDVINGIRLTNGDEVNEIRFCQINNI